MAISTIESLPYEIEQELEQLRQLAHTAPPITSNPERMGGTPVIGLSRVPVTALLDYIIEGQTLEEFLDSFPAVDRAAALAALEQIKAALDEGWLAAQVDY
ncbi:MAG: DUF433 domain-containing protein [Blastocatellia bacterium]